MNPTAGPAGPPATGAPPQHGAKTVDKPTPLQGTLNNDAANTGGGTVSLVDQGTGTPGKPATGTSGTGRNRVPLIAGAIVLALIGAGLITWSQVSGSPDPQPTPPPTTPTTVTSGTPSPTPTLSAEQIAVRGATEGYVQYRKVTEAMYASGGKSVADLPSVSAGLALKIDQSGAKTYRNRGLRQVGNTRLVWSKASSIGTPAAGGVVADVVLASCIDSSSASTVDSTGKALPKEGGTSARVTEQTTLKLFGTTWKVVESYNQVVKSC